MSESEPILDISQLRALVHECAQPGWDGEAAERMNPMAVNLAEEFIRAFPELPLPEFAPEPDGSVSLDWVVSRHRSFTVSVGASRRLAYAWLDGSDKGHGVAYFDGVRFSSRLVEGIRSIVEHGTPA